MGEYSNYYSEIYPSVHLSPEEVAVNELFIFSENYENENAIFEIKENLKRLKVLKLESSNFNNELEVLCESLEEIHVVYGVLNWIEYCELREKYGKIYEVIFEAEKVLNVNVEDFLKKDISNLHVNYQIAFENDTRVSIDSQGIKVESRGVQSKMDSGTVDAIEKIIVSQILEENGLSSVNSLYVNNGLIDNEALEVFFKKNKFLKSIIIRYEGINLKLLSSCEKLETLILYKTNIENLNILPYMRNLTILYIDSNKLENVDSLYQKFPNLEFFRASNNKITRFPKKFPKKLRELDLSNNHISGNIDNIPSAIENLDLSKNKINKVTLKNLPNIHKLNLSYNEIKEIVGIQHLNASTSLIIDYNPIINDTKWLQEVQAQASLSILPRIVFKNQKDVIGTLGIIEESEEEIRKHSNISSNILARLNYSEATNGSFSAKETAKSLDKSISFMIKGKWGSGKSYYFQNELKAKLQENNYEIIEYIPTLNTDEEAFKTILSKMNNSNESYVKYYLSQLNKRKWLLLLLFSLFMLINIGVEYFNYYEAQQFLGSSQTSNLINDKSFNYISSLINALPLSIFLTAISMPVGLLHKNEEELDLERILKKRSKKNYIIFIDDLERAKVDKQIEIINAIQSLKNHVHIITLIDEEELKKILFSYYSNDFNYSGFKSKIFDYQYSFQSISLIDYYTTNIVINEIRIDSIFKLFLSNSNLLKDMSIREFKKSLNEIFHNISDIQGTSLKEKIGLIISGLYSGLDVSNYTCKYINMYLLLVLECNCENMQIKKYIDVLLDFDFFVVNYDKFSEHLKSQIDNNIIDGSSFDIELSELDYFSYVPDIKITDIDNFIIELIEKGMFDIICNDQLVSNKNDLREKIFKKINKTGEDFYE